MATQKKLVSPCLLRFSYNDLPNIKPIFHPEISRNHAPSFLICKGNKFCMKQRDGENEKCEIRNEKLKK